MNDASFELNKRRPVRAFRAACVLLLLAGCASSASVTPSDSREFALVVTAILGALRAEGWEQPFQVDPWPVAPDSYAATAGRPEAVPQARLDARIEVLEDLNAAAGDLVVAEKCAHVGGMGGLMIEPLSEAARELLRFCRTAFRGLTVGISVPDRPAGGLTRYRALVFGADAEMAWDVFVGRGEVVRLAKVMDYQSE